MFKRKRRENSEICRLTEEERLAKIRELEAKRDGVISELEELMKRTAEITGKRAYRGKRRHVSLTPDADRA